MPIGSIFKKSSGSLIILALMQGQAVIGAEVPANSSWKPSQQALDVSETGKDGSSESSREISAIEKRFFEHDFQSETSDERLTRLEQLIFGETKLGIDSERLSSISKVVNKANSDGSAKAAFNNAIKPDSVKETKSGTDIEVSEGNDPRKLKQSFSGALESGINNFKLKRFHHAEDDFERAVTLNPHSAEAYANLAGTLLMLRDKQSAIEAFKACYAIQPFGKLGAYAREQILKLAQDDAYSKTDAQDSPTTVSRTIRQINRQTADRARIYQAQANVTARNRIDLANIEIMKLTADTQLAIADLRANRANGGNYGARRNNNGTGYEDPYARQDISNMNYIRTDYIRTDGQVQSNKALTEGYNKSASVFDSGTSLKDQLLQPVQPGGARLRALGTSLYARYYGDGMPSTGEPPMVDPSLPGLHATAKSLSGRQD